MAKTVDCSLGAGRPYKTKREAEDAADGAPVKRCARCRYWHVVRPKGRRRRG
jgi:hypothetical protein